MFESRITGIARKRIYHSCFGLFRLYVSGRSGSGSIQVNALSFTLSVYRSTFHRSFIHKSSAPLQTKAILQTTKVFLPVPMSLITTAKIVLVTGANQGLGFEIAKSLSSKPGYHVLMGSRNAQRGIKAASVLQEQGLVVEALTIELVLAIPFSPCLGRLYSRRFYHQ